MDGLSLRTFDAVSFEHTLEQFILHQSDQSCRHIHLCRSTPPVIWPHLIPSVMKSPTISWTTPLQHTITDALTLLSYRHVGEESPAAHPAWGIQRAMAATQRLFFLDMACGGGAQRRCGSCVWARFLSTDCCNHLRFYPALSDTAASRLWQGNHAVAYAHLRQLRGVLGLLLAPWEPHAQWWRCAALTHTWHDLPEWTQWRVLPGQDPRVHWLPWLLPALEGSAEQQHAAWAFLWLLQGSAHQQYIYPFSPWRTYSAHSTAAPSPSLLISGMGHANVMKPGLPPYSPIPPMGSLYPYPFGHTCRGQGYGGSYNSIVFVNAFPQAAV